MSADDTSAMPSIAPTAVGAGAGRWALGPLAALADAVILATPDGIVRAWNAPAAAIWGYAESDLVGYPLHGLCTAEAGGELAALLAIARRDGRAPARDLRGERRDGESIVVWMSAALLPAADGRPDALVLVARDVTAERRAVRELREGEIRRRTVVETAADGIVTLTADGRIETANAAVERLFGWPPHELTGRHVRVLLPAPHCHEYRRYLERPDGGDARGATFELAGVRKDGSSFPMELSVGGMTIGDARKFTVIVRDVTERRRGEAALRESEARIRAIVDAAVDGILVIDEHGAIESLNPAAERLFGWAAHELLGQPCTRLVVETDDGGPFGAAAASRDRDEPARSTVEVVGRRKDGSTFPMELDLNTLGGPGATKTTAIVRDVTARRQDEDEVARYVAEMEESRDRIEQQAAQLAGLAEELAAARDDAERATRAKSEFLAVISHEIRTPTSAMIGMTDLLLETTLSEEQRRYATVIHRGGTALLALIDDVLDIAKIEAGHLELEHVPLEPRAVLDEVLDLLANEAERRGLELVARCDVDVPGRAVGDPGRLRQILLNLVTNGLEFTERGEVVVHLAVEPSDGDHLRLRCTVADTGVGIPPEAQASLFSSFMQVGVSSDPRRQRSGLGLAFCRTLVEAMDGAIGVQSVPGAGSTFWFTVALDHAAPLADDAAPSLPAGLHVLVVDDNASARAAARYYLEATGATVVEAEDGATAMEALWAAAAENRRIDVVLIDQRMPGMNGLALCQALADDAALAAVPRILVTRHAAPRPRGAEDTIAAVLLKPVRPTQLLDAIAKALQTPTSASAAARRAADAAPPTPAAPVAGRRARVLVAEDDHFNLLVAVKLLERAGYELAAATTGDEVLTLLAREHFDVVLMDMSMPGLDGVHTTRVIREREDGTGRHVPIIALTANALTGDRERCIAAGMDAYLTKPFEAETLRGLVARVLAGARDTAGDASPEPATSGT